MTKREIARKIARKTGLQEDDIRLVLDKFFEVVIESMAQGNNVYLRKFGTFLVKKRNEKIGRVITKNKTIVIPTHYVPAFKACRVFKNKIKDNVKFDPEKES